MMEIISTYDDGLYKNKASDIIQIKDLAEYIIHNTPIWKNASIIWDYTEADFINISESDWINLLKHLKPYSKPRVGGKAALVGVDDSVIGSLLVLNEWSEVEKYPPNMKIFTKIDKAKEWLLSNK